MKTMKFYAENSKGAVEVLAVHVNQNVRWASRRDQTRNPAIAAAIAHKGGFKTKAEFGEARLARAKREGRVLPATIVKGEGA